MFRRPVKSALFIDFDNMVAALKRPFIDSIPQWVAWLEDGQFDPRRRRRTFEQKRVYWNTPFDVHREVFLQNGFEVIPCPSRVRRNKSAADMIIALDAFQSSYDWRRIREYIVLSMDTDFIPLLDKLAEKDKATVAACNAATLAVFSDHADIVIPVTTLEEAINYLRPKRSLLNLFRSGPSRRVHAARALGAGPADISTAAEIVAETAARTPGFAIGKQAIDRALRNRLPGFTIDGRSAYLGFGSYASMIERIVAMRPELRLVRYSNGGIALMAPAKDEAA